MRIAQKLYESGLITYMRTDSMNLSTLCLDTAEPVIAERMGANYHKRRNYHTKSRVRKRHTKQFVPQICREKTFRVRHRNADSTT